MKQSAIRERACLLRGLPRVVTRATGYKRMLRLFNSLSNLGQFHPRAYPTLNQRLDRLWIIA